MKMIGSRHNYRVNILVRLIEHFAKIAILFGIRKFLERVGCAFRIHVAQGDDIAFFGDLIDIGFALSTDPNASDIDSVTGGVSPPAAITWRGTIMMPAATAEVVRRNSRRFEPDWIFFIIFR